MSLLSTAEPKPLPHALSDLEELRPFAQVRLIAFDLDGTLIGGQEASLGPRLARLFALVSHTNVMVTLATGRTLAGVAATLGSLGGLGRVPLVLYNGSVIMRPEEAAVIKHFEIPARTAQGVIKIASSRPGVSTYVYCIDPEAALIGGSTTTEAVYFAGQGVAPVVDFNRMPVRAYADLDLSHERVVAILVECTNPRVRTVLHAALKDLPEISVTTSGAKYLEVRPAGTSKAAGIEHLTTRLGIAPAQVLAVGDNDNDVELLSWAGLSVCVQDSSAAARQASKFYSAHGAGNAAIELLELVRRAQRLFRQGKGHGYKAAHRR
jgi:Cof subfamily protein (haloacid dehalogenase superfamily)